MYRRCLIVVQIIVIQALDNKLIIFPFLLLKKCNLNQFICLMLGNFVKRNTLCNVF